MMSVFSIEKRRTSLCTILFEYSFQFAPVSYNYSKTMFLFLVVFAYIHFLTTKREVVLLLLFIVCLLPSYL